MLTSRIPFLIYVEKMSYTYRINLVKCINKTNYFIPESVKHIYCQLV